MRLSILTLCFVVSSLACKSQRIIFSDHFIDNAQYKLIGAVNKNIIVCTNDDDNSSKILVFDNELHLIRKVSSRILKSDTEANPEYFSLNDSFGVVYQYNVRNELQYRLTFFDDNGTQLSTIIVDSVTRDKTKAEGDNYFYTLLLSSDKKTICFSKLAFNPDSFVVKISCTFLQNNVISHEQFLLPFDFVHESIDDFLIDNNKNFVLLQTITSDSAFTVRVTKKVFSNDYFLIASKKINAGFLVNGSVHLINRFNSYLVYGLWQNKLIAAEKEKQYISGFYKWTTDLNLDDKTADTVLNKVVPAENWKASYIKSEKGGDFFSLEKYIKDTSGYQQYEESYGNSSWQNEVMRSVDLGSLPHISDADMLELSTLEHYQNSSIPSVQILKKPVNNTTETGIDVFSLSNSNELNWLKNLDSGYTELTQSLNNKILVTGTTAIHIIYSKQLTNYKTGISQTIISYDDGTSKNDNIPVWNSSYIYFLDRAIKVGNNSIVIPCYKSKKIFFAKFVFE